MPLLPCARPRRRFTLEEPGKPPVRKYRFPYDVALWATIADFPYSWPLWQRYAERFINSHLASVCGFPGSSLAIAVLLFFSKRRWLGWSSRCHDALSSTCIVAAITPRLFEGPTLRPRRVRVAAVVGKIAEERKRSWTQNM